MINHNKVPTTTTSNHKKKKTWGGRLAGSDRFHSQPWLCDNVLTPRYRAREAHRTAPGSRLAISGLSSTLNWGAFLGVGYTPLEIVLAKKLMKVRASSGAAALQPLMLPLLTRWEVFSKEDTLSCTDIHFCG